MTAIGTILGTTSYMSPEQARGLPVDGRTDVWAFGCILFEALAGRAAFAGDSAWDRVAGVLEREPEWQVLPAGVPPRLRDLLRRCLAKRADERPETFQVVGGELRRATAPSAPPADAALEKSIAVLPFAHASGDDDEYFADGMTEEILNALTQLAGLRVAARTSSFAFKGRRVDLREVAEKLGVATVLEGSVRRAGTRLRITVQLANAADGYQLWSERYDRELTDVFAVQDEIAAAIAARLKLALARGATGATGRRGTENLEAYDLVLRARAVQARRGRHLIEARQYLERAIELDPGYAEAQALLADSYRLAGTYGMASSRAVMPRARAAAERALAADPESVEALATMADVEAQYEWNTERALALWNRALEIDPRHTRSRCERALWILGLGGMTVEQAISEVERAVGDDPLNSWAIGMWSLILSTAERHDESVAAARRGLEADPASFFAQWSLLAGLTWAGRYDEAVALGPAMLADSGRHLWVLAALARAHAGAGRVGIARAIHDEVEARSRMERVSPAWRAAVAAAAGRMDEAMALAGQAVEERDPFAVVLGTLPAWKPLRGQPGYPELQQRVRAGGGEVVGGD
jgi:serine/threonine-protein kinase